MTDPSELDARADTAAASVQAIFGKRLLGLPGTWLPTVAGPGRRIWRGPWHYWWHAHVIDALLDQALRNDAAGDRSRAADAVTRAAELLRTVRLRNLGQFRNHYYDDMAWVALAAERLHRMGAVPLARRAVDVLATPLHLADTPELGGGLYWNDDHDFKNVPATAPTAIFLARTGQPARAHRLVDWLYGRLVDPDSGLVLDGLRIGPDGSTTLVRDVYTYNQGTVLGALVELGDPVSLDRAAQLIAATRSHLTTDADRRLLRTHGGGDGGLFTGIHVRYLALAAHSPDLSPTARSDARAMVLGSADALWSGRDNRTLPARAGMPPGPVTVFSPDPAVPASLSQPGGIRIELSTQVQAWTILEAAATLSADPGVEVPAP